MYLNRVAVFLLLYFVIVLPSFAGTKPDIPDPLKPWADWVLHGHEEALNCIPQYDDPSKMRCSWPTELKLSLDNAGGDFEQEWFINYEQWVTLPGGSLYWPENVKINNIPYVVVMKKGRPKVKLEKGSHKITGGFRWNKLPEHIEIPPGSALVTLQIEGKEIDFPTIDDQGRLWLQTERQKVKKIENRLNVKSYRLIDDRIPPRIVLHMNFDVAGSAREILLGPAFSTTTFIPVSLESSLPARVEQDGRIRMQIRPGKWALTLTLRHIGPLSSFDFHKPEDGFWPKEEIWVFNAHNNLRIVEIEGVPLIDPKQTSLPESWRNYPAYRLLTGERMIFKEIKRGDADPAPDQLKLDRNLWLRFDGSGYTIQDRITGKKNNDWRLEMNPPVSLGRVAVDGVEQFITRLEGADRSGIELRKGAIQLSADSEYRGNISRIPATGWDHEFQQVNARLLLPPGYRLLYATGADNVPNTWLTRWTLLDLFVVLIFSIAAARLYSLKLSLLAFITLVLLYHEAGAPRWIWLAILLGIALLRHLPNGRFRQFVKMYQIITAVLLIAISVPFAISHLRTGIYPQLEKPWQSMVSSYPASKIAPSTPMEAEQQVLSESDTYRPGDYSDLMKAEDNNSRSIMGKFKSKGYYQRRQTQVAQYDPNMINQTGPGLPAWQWNTVHMNMGPVQRGQEISLTIIGPKANLILSFARVGFLILLALGIYGIRYQKNGGWRYPDAKTFLTATLLLFSLCAPFGSQASDIPSHKMLEEMQKRILEKDDCFPACADISRMDINITPDNLHITMNVDSHLNAAVPLPGNGKHWLPKEVFIDKQKVNALYKNEQGFWILIPPGKHEVVLEGILPQHNTVQLPMPLKPHRIEIEQKGWTSEGVHQDGTIDNQIQFKRITEGENVGTQILDTGVLPPFALVQRTLLLGLDWKIETQVQRISPTGSAIVLAIPLLEGESVVTEGVVVKNGVALINLDAGTGHLQWESFLEKKEEIVLRHGETDQWTEIWQVDVSPIFHLDYEGIPVILHQQGNRWNPQWHPWPGEEVKLRISRPAGVAGQTLTIDRSHLEVRPGQRATDSKLTLSIRSSQGGQHTIVLPEEAQLQEVSIGGKLQPIRQQGRNVPLPIAPGSQEVVLQWRAQKGMSMKYATPDLDLGMDSANTNIDVYVPRNRWPLVLTGPQLGPAVLFWSVVIVIILTAFGLSRTGLTPLKFRHWFLLGIGMSQSNVVSALIVVGWLLALHFRRKIKSDMKKRAFNSMQTGIVLITILAIGGLVFAISQGLLGHPDMNIIGNGSSSGLLRWYQDYSDRNMTRAWIFSVPMVYYRLAMLAWALWISFYLISILKWGWQSFSCPKIWYSMPGSLKSKRKINLYKEGTESPKKK